MNKKIFLPFLGIAIAAGIIIISSCQKDAVPVAPKVDYSFTQDFDSMSAMLAQGWTAKNNSRPLGTTTWASGEYHWLNDPKKGISPVGSYPGYNTSHSGRDYAVCLNTCQDDPAVVSDFSEASCWLISPAVPLKNGDIISFWTRTLDEPTGFKDKMELRINTNNSGVEVGNDSSTVGDFTFKALVVNEAFTGDGYPGGTAPSGREWTNYTYTISNMPVPKMGRFAFRYYVPEAGPNGKNGTGVGVDAVEFKSKYIP
jgi:hypothetical protein